MRVLDLDADRADRAGVRAGAAGGRDLREPDQLPAARARRRRRHHQRHQVPQRPQRRDRRRGGRLGLGHRGSDPADAALGPVDRPARGLADRARACARSRSGWSGTTPTAWRWRTWAEQHPAIARVHYPGLPSHPDHALRREVLDGFGGMVGLELKGGAARRRAHARAAQADHPRAEPRRRGEPGLRAPAHVAPPAQPTSSAASWASPTASCGSRCGLEDADDIIADLEQALGWL